MTLVRHSAQLEDLLGLFLPISLGSLFCCGLLGAIDTDHGTSCGNEGGDTGLVSLVMVVVVAAACKGRIDGETG
jgi:hypothetical protein